MTGELCDYTVRDPLQAIVEFSGIYRFLSNFHPCIIPFEGFVYPSVEHGFQAAKTLDHKVRKKIRGAKTPGEAKRLGKDRELVVLRDNWEHIKVDTMSLLLKRKFSIPELRLLLLCTGDRELVEGNWWGDTFWGVCKGKGYNNLGNLLMQHRSAIRNDLLRYQGVDDDDDEQDE